ncbi:MAG: NAD-dependent deacylase [Vicinamibacteria bacterium]|nr:NAD-dependent deacylase [Vicinamibacteria bacterium]
MTPVPTLDLEDARLLVLTGAGVSAESGLATFRDSNGLWEQHDVQDVASPEGFERDPRLVWKFYSLRREQAKTVQPNAGHRALADVEKRLQDRFMLVTQNIDGLHQRAGSDRVIEIHGSLFRTKCSRCDRAPFDDQALYLEGALPVCRVCEGAGHEALLRPDIVWFGEMLDQGHLRAIDAFMRRDPGSPSVFLAVGTSGVVWPVAGLVNLARSLGASTCLVNAEPADNTSRFHSFVQGKSAEVLPALFGLNRAGH